MNASSRRKAARLQAQTAEMLIAAPQVVAQRLRRMALAGTAPSAGDRREFHRMGAEKLAAFSEAWRAMALQMLASNQRLAGAMMRSAWPAALLRRRPGAGSLHRLAAEWQSAALDVLGQGLRPVHRRAVANARRLNRGRPR